MVRFQHIIRFSIYGHVHHEFYSVVRSFNDSSKPVASYYWTGSVSTWEKINPSFRVFEVDEETMLPVKVHTYAFDISDDAPEWKYHHELTELFDMKDLSPTSFDSLSDQMLVDEDMATKFLNTQAQGGPEGHVDSCDETCRTQAYCLTRNAVYFDAKDCMGEKRMDLRNDAFYTFTEFFIDPWYSTN